MNRRLILIGFGVLVAVAIALVIKIRSGDHGASAAPPGDPKAGTPVADSVAAPDRAKPSLPSEAGGSAGPDDYTETVINGIRVRDHRKNPEHPVDLPPNIRPPATQRLPSDLVHAISGKLQEVMKDCARAIPKEARGTKPKIEGTIFVDVKGGSLEVKESTVQLRDVTGDTTAVKQCFEQKSLGQKVPSGKTEDTAHYSISILFTIPELL